MRLIDADAFEKNMQNEWERNEISNGEWIHFREMINEEPTIEEREKGKWERDSDTITDYDGVSRGAVYGWRCSECEAFFQDTSYGWNYCPSCGSEMEV